MDTLSLTKEARIYSGLKTISLTSGAGKNVIQFLKVTFHLQFVQSLGSIPYFVHYILEPIMCNSHFPVLILPFPPSFFPLVTTVCSLYL